MRPTEKRTWDVIETPPVDLSPRRLHVVTADGVRLALHRFQGGDRGAVIGCHGLAANRLAFDLDDGSLARHLARAGFDVFLLELRGHGASERPRTPWSFDTYAESDLPAAIAAVAAIHGPRIGWVGHSMGGILALSYLASGGAGLAAAVTVGSALDYSGSASGFHRLLPLRNALRFLPMVPVDLVARRSAAFVGRWRSPYERFNVWSSNVDPVAWRKICEGGFHPVSPPVMSQLATAFQAGGLRSNDGARCYLEGLAQSRTPLLALAGSRDAQCPPEAVLRTSRAVGGAEALIFGRDHGCADDYGHFDLLIGRRAAQEVFPRVEAWLAAALSPGA
jgi:alpha-beta hydrolase superfamily lysophospholipase